MLYSCLKVQLEFSLSNLLIINLSFALLYSIIAIGLRFLKELLLKFETVAIHQYEGIFDQGLLYAMV